MNSQGENRAKKPPFCGKACAVSICAATPYSMGFSAPPVELAPSTYADDARTYKLQGRSSCTDLQPISLPPPSVRNEDVKNDRICWGTDGEGGLRARSESLPYLPVGLGWAHTWPVITHSIELVIVTTPAALFRCLPPQHLQCNAKPLERFLSDWKSQRFGISVFILYKGSSPRSSPNRKM